MCKRELLRVLLCAICIPAWCTPIFSQIKWDGGGNDGLWTTAANWSNNTIPVATDSIVFDNSIVGADYTVKLPASVTVKIITIRPANGRTIELTIPSDNKAVPALTIDKLTIYNGGVFRNASGADSGQTVMVSDSLRINNGGRYVQQTDRSHAAVVTRLSRATGTEEGVFEFDVPTASNTVSLSGRVFGKLVLSSNAYAGVTTYTATGTNGVVINSDLVIGEGVNFSLNMADTMFIRRDLVQQGGTFNLSNAARALVVGIGRHLIQSNTGIITESGSAIPEIIFNGKEKQQVNGAGAIQNSVACSVRNQAGIALLSALSLPFLLHLNQGAITTTSSNLLTLLPGCTLQIDSVNGNSFINGPLRVEGLSNSTRYVVPVGKDNIMRWTALTNATGNFTVEYIKSNPRSINANYDTGIDHIMGVEYWSIKADASPLPSASIELSFTGPNNIDITDLSALRVAWLSGSSWMNGGHAWATGSAGAAGSVLSNVFTHWNKNAIYFSLASSMPPGGLLALPDRPPPRTHSPSSTNDLSLRLIDYAPIKSVLSCRSPERSLLTVVIMNSAGSLVSVKNYSVEKGINKVLLNTSLQPAGLYFIQAFSPKGKSNVLRIVRL